MLEFQNDLFMLLALFCAFFVKHFVIDYPLQPKYMYANKGTFGHPGGILHSGLHGIATQVILMWFGCDPATATLIAGAEFVIHYAIDWAKMNLNKALGWGPTTCEEFWWLLGLDQLLHYLTYAGAIYWAFYWNFQYGY